MSEQAKPVCSHCELPIHGTAYGGEGEWRHFNTDICSVAQIREIAALRAALDQERADNAKLRAFAQEIVELICGEGLVKQIAHAHDLLDDKGNPTALLSGRGEGGNDG